MKHLLSIEQLSEADITGILQLARKLKGSRGRHLEQPLAGQCWALVFSKSSTRTRVSFEVGIRELGGSSMFLSAADMQLGRGEPIEDTARVLGRMVHGAIIRTYAQDEVERFAQYSGIPTINALTDAEHPCQILADLLTIDERFGGLNGRKVCFIGDGDCNVARSWIWAAARCGFELTIVAPKAFQPPADLVARAGNTRCTDDLGGVAGAEILYTDVWVSMGKESEGADRIEALREYQINEQLVKRAAPGAIVMHCLPAYRGKEITGEVFEQFADVIFDEAENRLHAQKAVLTKLVD
jgi:ornithine carbamoyltransferase